MCWWARDLVHRLLDLIGQDAIIGCFLSGQEIRIIGCFHAGQEIVSSAALLKDGAREPIIGVQPQNVERRDI